MEGARGRQPTPVPPVFIPGRIRSSLPPIVSATSISSRRCRHRRKPSSSPTASELSTLTATSSGPFTPAAASVESSTSAATPESTEFPAGFDSRPGWRRSCRAVVFGEFRTDASYPSTEGPSAMVSSQLLSPELVGGHPASSAGQQSPVRPPVSTWPIKAAQSPKDPGPQPVATKLQDPQHAAKLHEPQQPQHAAKLHEPQQPQHAAKLHEPHTRVPESPEGSEDGPPQPRVPEFPEGSEDGPPRPRVSEFPKGSEDRPPQTRVPEFPEGSEDGPPQPRVPEFPEGSEDGPPQPRVPEFPEGSEDGPPQTRVPEFPEGFRGRTASDPSS
ncbi:hypothetical protein CRENBAI_008230 [Crenichthys baileyi]|uniref:Uncharacterized protein n=1 Tax=Crenichthys baileyi TaxID=28760 RepID=A0AAV9QUM2_9TELE